MNEYEYIEVPVGTEIITQDINGNKVKVICKEGDGYNCSNCIFYENKTCSKMYCQPHLRSDRKHVYFEQIEETDNANFSTGEEIKSNTKEFIKSVQDWKDDKGNTSVIHIEIMSTDGIVSCRLSLYPNENVQTLSEVYVNENYRTLGYCNQMLDYIKEHCNYRPYTLVYINNWTNEYIKRMYEKRNYIILTN